MVSVSKEFGCKATWRQERGPECPWGRDPRVKPGLPKGAPSERGRLTVIHHRHTDPGRMSSPTFWVRKKVSLGGALTNVLLFSYKLTF